MTDQITATGTFDVDLTPGDALLPGTARLDLRKTWSGEVSGTSTGVMLSAGDPSTGNAGYVALEVFSGEIAGQAGTLVLQQSGTMTAGDPVLRYEVAPGSGTGDLAGYVGHVALDMVDGVHHVTVTLHRP